MFADLDNFKAVNDRWGHAVGDKLLIEVGRRLRAVVREPNVVSRLGGDEFGVAIVDSSRTAEARALFDRLKADLAKPFYVDEGCVVPIAVSMGLAFDDGGGDIASLMRAADESMYGSKRKRSVVRIATAAFREEDGE